MVAEGVAGGQVPALGVVQRIKHFFDMLAPLIVLVEHDTNRSTLAQYAAHFHDWEQTSLFLAVMAAVGKVLEEVDGLAGRFTIQHAVACESIGDLLQTA